MKRMQRLLFPALALCCLLMMGGWFLGRGSADGVSLRTQRPAQADLPAEDRAFPDSAPTQPGINEKLDLNRATLEDLMQLPGIGQQRAESILAYRSEHGPFRHTADLMLVEGIGEKTYAGLRNLIYVEEYDENSDH